MRIFIFLKAIAIILLVNSVAWANTAPTQQQINAIKQSYLSNYKTPPSDSSGADSDTNQKFDNAATALATAQIEYDSKGCGPQKNNEMTGDCNIATGNLINAQNEMRSVTAEKAAADSKDAVKSATEECSAKAEKAVSSCSVLDPATQAALNGTLSQANQAMSQGGTKGTCNAAKLISAGSGAANLGLAVLCETAIASCRNTCKKIEDDTKQPDAVRKAAKAKHQVCSDQEGKVIASGVMGLQNLMQAAMGQKCEDALANATPPPGTTPGSMGDCSDPMFASMPQCVCAANPNDPVCSGTNAGLGLGGGVAMPGSGITGLGDGAHDPTAPNLADEIGKLDPTAPPAAQANGNSGGGGGLPGGGGAQALPPEDAGGAGHGPYNTDIMGGLAGGSGGGGFSGGNNNGGSSGGSLLGSLAEKFNLKGFLPKSEFKNRGLASGGGADGITGPNGPSLFEKVSSRYHKKQSELLP